MTLPATTDGPSAVLLVAPRDERVVKLRVRGLPDLPAGDRAFCPEKATILYTRKGGEPWTVVIYISGQRRLLSGRLGASTESGAFYRPEDTDPSRWRTRRPAPDPLPEFVEHYWPKEAP